MEKTEPSDVLLLPELLVKIFDYCSSSSYQNLLNFRQVCSVWKDCVSQVFVKKVTDIPSIDFHDRYPTFAAYNRCLPEVLQKFFKSVTPSCSIPFRIYLTQSTWCRELQTVFKNYSRNIVHLQINDFLFEKALKFTDFPQLKKLELVHWDYEGVTSSKLTKDYFQTKALHLADLLLDVGANIQFGAMKNLKVLQLCGGSSVSGSQSLADLLPNLTEVKFGTQNTFFHNSDAFEGMAAIGAVFEKVVNLEIHEQWGEHQIFEEEEDTHAAEIIVKCFPNLKKVKWTTVYRISKRMSSVQVLFSGLKHLTSIGLVFLEEGTGAEVFQLLTGMTVDEIPEQEDQWASALMENEKAVCNLTNLECLYVQHDKNYRKDPNDRKELTPTQSSFLLKAVFMKMDALRKITLVHIPYDQKCIHEWKQTGCEFHKVKVEVGENDDE